MKIERATKETRVGLEMKLGSGNASTHTGIPFLDHMLVTLARYSGIDITVNASGDMAHHIIEDVAITAGSVLAAILPESCARFGDRTIAMDDALVQVVLDAGGRSFYRGPLPSSLYDHWMRSFSENAGMTLHIRVLRGRDRHHIVEAAFKALGLGLRQALDQGESIFSTKGSVTVERS
jgi:imidazoleglycerol-phosphate dehydratase